MQLKRGADWGYIPLFITFITYITATKTQHKTEVAAKIAAVMTHTLLFVGAKTGICN